MSHFLASRAVAFTSFLTCPVIIKDGLKAWCTEYAHICFFFYFSTSHHDEIYYIFSVIPALIHFCREFEKSDFFPCSSLTLLTSTVSDLVFFFVRINLCVSLLPISTGLQRQVHESFKIFSSGDYAATKVFIIYAMYKCIFPWNTETLKLLQNCT